MFKVPHRCIVLRDEAVDGKRLNKKLLGHHLLRVEGIQNAESMYRGKNACLVASGIANIIENSPPIIQEGELVVGYNYPDNPYPDWWICTDLARKLQLDPSIDETRRMELEQIERVCRQVPAKPARSFHEAVQSLWFAHIINTWEDGINANSLGRLDQILYPYYIHDIENGTITKEQVFELICCLWIKLYRDYDVQQSCVGGCLADGSSAVNDLSYMMLDATEQLGFVRCLSVRFSSQTDKIFLDGLLRWSEESNLEYLSFSMTRL